MLPKASSVVWHSWYSNLFAVLYFKLMMYMHGTPTFLLQFCKSSVCHPSVIRGTQSNSWVSLVTQLVKNPPEVQKTLVRFLGWDNPWGRDRLPIPVFMDIPGGSDGKESSYLAGDLDSILWLERYPGGGHGNPLPYSHLENSHGQRRLAGYSPWGHKQLDTTEWHTHIAVLLEFWFISFWPLLDCFYFLETHQYPGHFYLIHSFLAFCNKT